MSFYNHPYFQHQHPRRGDHPAFPAAPAHAPAFNFFTSPPPPPHPFYGSNTPPTYHMGAEQVDYEAEERAAIAQLRAIQYRRRLAEAEAAEQQAQADALRESREQAVRARREAEIRVLIEREIQQAREREVQKATEEREREVQRVREQRERERALLVEQHRQRVLAHAERERAKRYEYLREIQRVKAEKHRQWARCAGRPEREEEDNGAEDIHRFMRMLGINIGTEEKKEEVKVEEKKEDVPSQATDPTKPTETATALPDNINTLLDHFLGLKVQPLTQDVSTSQVPKDNKVPKGLNEFLSRFGLEFEPLNIEREISQENKGEKVEEKKVEEQKVEEEPQAVPAATSTPVAVPSFNTAEKSSNEYDLNNFLSRFGCQIDNSTYDQFLGGNNNNHHAESTSTPTASSSTSHPNPNSKVESVNENETPLTSYLNKVADIPPFVRDILSNVELAFKESHKEYKPQNEATYRGKGKGVAPGEKVAPQPKPTFAQTSSRSSNTPPSTSTTPSQPPTPLTKLNDISHDLYLTTASFTFPPTLSFSKLTNDPTAQTPHLLFNKTNSSYHAQAHKLLQLLLAADGIVSGGDAEVRSRRKEVVKRVEGEIEELERRRDEVWRERVERGEQDEGEELGSERSSVVGDGVEHLEEVHVGDDVEHVQNVQVEGFDVAEKAEVETAAPITQTENLPTTSTTTEEGEEKLEEEVPKEEDKSITVEDDKKSVTVEDVTDREEGFELV